MIKFKIFNAQFTGDCRPFQFEEADVIANRWMETHSKNIEVLRMDFSDGRICIMYTEKEPVKEVTECPSRTDFSFEFNKNNHAEKYKHAQEVDSELFGEPLSEFSGQWESEDIQ